MIKLIKYDGNEKQINDLLKKKYRDNIYTIYGLYENNKLVGHIIYENRDNYVKIHWLCAPGYGKALMDKMETIFRKNGYTKIILDVSIDPYENPEIIMKRINFYISQKYKVYDIKYREKHGPLFLMHKFI